MIRKTLAIVIALIALGLLSVLVLFCLLHTKYATPMVSYALDKTLNIKVISESVHYQYPNQLDFNNVHIERQGQESIAANSMSIWLTPSESITSPFRIHELLLSGSTLSRQSVSLAHDLSIDNIALDHIDYSDDNVIINDLQLQLRNLQYQPNMAQILGEFQLRASQIYYQGESANDVLIDGVLSGEESKVYGASFTWNQATVSTQAQYESGTWSLVNTTVDKLDLDLTTASIAHYNKIFSAIGHINSVDLLHANLRFNDVKIENLNASFEQIDLRHSIWEQVNAYLSFDADSIQYQSLQFIEPTVEVIANNGVITLKDVDSTLEQGRIQLVGAWKPNAIALERVVIDGVKVYEETQQNALLSLFQHLPLTNLNQLSIDHLTISRGQWIQIQNKPNWQISGLNLEGSNLELIRKGQWGLWQGKTAASANSVSIDRVLASQVALETQSHDGKWQLKRLFIPYQKGYLDVAASLDFSAKSQPLTVNAKAYSLPLSLLKYLQTPNGIDISGMADINLSMNVLTADKLAISKTLTGKLDAEFDNTAITSSEGSAIPVEITPLQLVAERGHVSLSPLTVRGERIDGEASGEIELNHLETPPIELKLITRCTELTTIDLLSGSVKQKPITSCLQEE
ncbi:AsmA family protein [Vibrio methylphosphonaticus]|uniref:AsmA family protein n=1 Tax=Vibrio methylphosphonaticus TaxID=2946866 RepID=UPI00202A7274|nr:AsmA family protein [Vibrio methylphosphonaticus]MCL9776464.1 AsmA family protein [Vibrio methylphosphonaticus]